MWCYHSVVGNGSIEGSVCRDSDDECGGLVGGADDCQSDNDEVDSGGERDCLSDDDGGPDCLRDGVRVRGGVRERGGVLFVMVVFCGAGGRGRCGVRVRGGVNGPGRGLGVHDHEVADLQWEPLDIADEELLDDTLPFSETEGFKV